MDWVALIALVSALIVIVAEFIPERRKNWRRTLVVTGGAIGAVFAFLATSEQTKYEAKIETLTTETRDLVTGGDSFAWLVFSPAKNDAASVHARIAQGGGKAPAFDVNVWVQRNAGRCDEVEPWTQPKVLGTGLNNPRKFYIPAVTPAAWHPIPVLFQPSCDDAYYLTLIVTRNRTSLQQTMLKKHEGQWRIATRVLDVNTSERLVYHVDPTFGDPKKLVWPSMKAQREALLQQRTELDAVPRSPY